MLWSIIGNEEYDDYFRARVEDGTWSVQKGVGPRSRPLLDLYLQFNDHSASTHTLQLLLSRGADLNQEWCGTSVWHWYLHTFSCDPQSDSTPIGLLLNHGADLCGEVVMNLEIAEQLLKSTNLHILGNGRRLSKIWCRNIEGKHSPSFLVFAHFSIGRNKERWRTLLWDTEPKPATTRALEWEDDIQRRLRPYLLDGEE